MSSVLVFGGTGWVGHHIALACRDAGHDVTIASRGRSTEHVHKVRGAVEMIQADKTDEEDVARVLGDGDFKIVIDSVPAESSINHIFNHSHRLLHYLHCSSTGGYAPLPFLPGDETMPYDHFMGGWKHKQVVDTHALHLHATEGFPATIIRPSYITGPGLLPLDNLGGRRDDFIADIVAEETLDLPDNGQALLQPIHVRDLAQVFRLAIERPDVSIGQTYNACLQKAVTLTRYLELTAAALDREARIDYLPLQAMFDKYFDGKANRGLAFLATHMCYDISKVSTHLDYRPSITTEQAISETARWAAQT